MRCAARDCTQRSVVSSTPFFIFYFIYCSRCFFLFFSATERFGLFAAPNPTQYLHHLAVSDGPRVCRAQRLAAAADGAGDVGTAEAGSARRRV